MEKQQDEEIEIDLLELFGVVRARWFSILMTGIILAAVAGIGTLFLVTPKYQSTSKLYIVGQTSALTSLSAGRIPVDTGLYGSGTEPSGVGNGNRQSET